MALAAAALLVVLGLAAVVGAIVTRGDGGTEQVASRTEAVLRSPGGQPVGSVTVERPSNDSSGARSELVVSVDPGSPEGTYRVECDYDTGAPYRAGSVEVTADGVESWRTAVSVPTYDLRRVRLVSTADGDNLEAEFPT